MGGVTPIPNQSSIMFVPHHGDYRSLEIFKGLGWGLWKLMLAFFVHFCPPFWDDSHVKFFFQRVLSQPFYCWIVWFDQVHLSGIFFSQFFFEKKIRIPIKTHQHRHKRVGEQLEFAECSEGFSLSMPFGFNHLVEWWLVGTDVGFGPRGGWQKHVALGRFFVIFFVRNWMWSMKQVAILSQILKALEFF